MDDLELGLCLRKAGVTINSTRDEHGREHFGLFTLHKHYFTLVCAVPPRTSPPLCSRVFCSPSLISPSRVQSLPLKCDALDGMAACVWRVAHHWYWIQKDMQNSFDNALVDHPISAHGAVWGTGHP